EIDEGKIVEFKGTYDEWLVWKEDKRKLSELQKETRPQSIPNPAPMKKKPNSKTHEEHEQIKSWKKDLQSKQKSFEKMEEKISQLLKDKVKLELQLSDPNIYADIETFSSLDNQYKSLETELQAEQRKQDVLFESIIELEEKIPD